MFRHHVVACHCLKSIKVRMIFSAGSMYLPKVVTSNVNLRLACLGLASLVIDLGTILLTTYGLSSAQWNKEADLSELPRISIKYNLLKSTVVHF